MSRALKVLICLTGVTISLSFLVNLVARNARPGSCWPEEHPYSRRSQQQDEGARLFMASFRSEKEMPRHTVKRKIEQVSPYYRRDRSDNSTDPLPPPNVLRRFLEDRWQARQNRNTDMIREIDRELQKRYGIYVYDHPRIWTRRADPPMALQRKRLQIRDENRKKRYGPRGHPLQRVGSEDPLPLPEPVIHDQLALWMDYNWSQDKKQREMADSVRFELSLHGVFVNATNMEWTTDPDHLFSDSHRYDNRTITDFSSKSPKIMYARLQDDNVTEQDLRKNQRERRIAFLLERHREVSMTGRHKERIFLNWELACSYGVQWSKKYGIWMKRPRKRLNSTVLCKQLSSVTSLPGFHDDENVDPSEANPPLVFYNKASTWNSPMYQQSKASLETLEPEIMDRVRFLVQERIHKREEHKFVEADAMREELWKTYVSVRSLWGVVHVRGEEMVLPVCENDCEIVPILTYVV